MKPLIWLFSRPIKYFILLWLLIKNDYKGMKKEGLLSGSVMAFFTLVMVLIFIEPKLLLLFVIVMALIGAKIGGKH